MFALEYCEMKKHCKSIVDYSLSSISGVLSYRLRRLEEVPLDAEDNVSDTGSALGNGFGLRLL